MTETQETRVIPFRAGARMREATADTQPEIAARVLPPPTGVLLADVSEFQPQVADGPYLAWSKAIVIRALYGDAHDDQAWYGGQRRQLLHQGGARFLGIYQYLVASQPGAAQARAFYQLVGAIQPGEVFIADFEEGTSAQVLHDWYNEMLTLYGAGIHPYLWAYSYVNFVAALRIAPPEWIAYYGWPEPSAPHKLWQFTDAFPVPGVGTCDCSVFDGTIDQLAALAYPGQQAPPQPQPWVFGPVRDLKVLGAGHESVKLEWNSPGQPMPLGVGFYEVTIRKNGQDLDSYPRFRGKGSNPEVYQFGSLPPRTQLEALVRAVATDGGHASPWATVSFTTAG